MNSDFNRCFKREQLAVKTLEIAINFAVKEGEAGLTLVTKGSRIYKVRHCLSQLNMMTEERSRFQFKLLENNFITPIYRQSFQDKCDGINKNFYIISRITDTIDEKGNLMEMALKCDKLQLVKMLERQVLTLWKSAEENMDQLNRRHDKIGILLSDKMLFLKKGGV